MFRSSLEAHIAILVINLIFNSNLALSQDVMRYELIPATIIKAGADPPYMLQDHEVNNVPPTLLGLRLIGDAVYLCDEITSKLIKLDWCGQEVFAIGSKGTGPEDHLGTGEPLVWPGCAVARSDCTVSPKLICYNKNGQFLRSIKIDGFNQYLRIIRGGTRGFGLAMTHRRQADRDFLIRIYLASISDSGTLLDSLLVKEHRLIRTGGQRPREEDLEVTPRLESDGAGRIYLQRDMYIWDIECLDEDLNQIWRLHRNVDPVPRTEEDLLVTEGYGIEPARYRHVIRRIVPRTSGVVWVQTTRNDERPMELHLEQFNQRGQMTGEVVISGLPKLRGDISIEGNRAIWKRDDDAYVSGLEPYIIVFDLVAHP